MTKQYLQSQKNASQKSISRKQSTNFATHHQPSHTNSSQSLTSSHILQLQRLVGNQAVLDMMSDNTENAIQREPEKTGTEEKAEKDDVEKVIKKLAGKLVEIGGTADASDKEVVVAEMIKIPLPALKALKEKGVKVVVCRNSVTEIREDLKGVRPRGWPEGSTWDSVPGLNDPNNDRVIIATRDGKVPEAGNGHGGHNLVLHEVGHAIGDAVETGGIDDPKFIAAREKDKEHLDDYEGQAGNPGVRETYAESFARFYDNDPDDATTYPNLHAYWASDPFIADK